jgi:hypothetical protein
MIIFTRVDNILCFYKNMVSSINIIFPYSINIGDMKRINYKLKNNNKSQRQNKI